MQQSHGIFAMAKLLVSTSGKGALDSSTHHLGSSGGGNGSYATAMSHVIGRSFVIVACLV